MKALEGFALGRLTRPLTFEINSAGPQAGQYDPTPRYPDGTPIEKGFSTGSGRGRKPGGTVGVGHSADAKAQMIERYKAGEGLQVLAAAYSTNVTRVREILIQAGVTIRPFGGQKNDEQRSNDMPRVARELSAEDKQVICRRYVQGKSVKDLARQYHIAQPRIREVLAQGGVETRKRGFSVPVAISPEPPADDQMDDPELMVAVAVEAPVVDEVAPLAAAPEPSPADEDVAAVARQRARELHRKAQGAHMVVAVQELPVASVLARKQYSAPRILESGAMFVNNPHAAAKLVENLVAELNQVPGVQAYFEWRSQGSVGQPLAR